MEKNILLTIAYDGAEFHGWQRQPHAETVQGRLEDICSAALNENVALNGASRTDAGVHAIAQRASFVTDTKIPVSRLARVLNDSLASREKKSFDIPAIRITAAEEVPADFHARFNAKGKLYIYKIRNSQETNLFLRKYVYHISERLDMKKMQDAAKDILGTHDFKSFESSGGTERETTVRNIHSLDIVETGRDKAGRDIEIRVSGDGFLYNMVRIMTGTLVEIGTGMLKAESMAGIIEKRDRQSAGHTAPPFGLYLAEVYY